MRGWIYFTADAGCLPVKPRREGGRTTHSLLPATRALTIGRAYWKNIYVNT